MRRMVSSGFASVALSSWYGTVFNRSASRSLALESAEGEPEDVARLLLLLLLLLFFCVMLLLSS